MLDELLKHVAVIGAGGKMGSGIALLLLQEMARTELDKTGNVGGRDYSLTLIDLNDKSLFDLRRYLRTQIVKYAERKINFLRKAYANNSRLVSNEEMIDAFVEGACDLIRLEHDVTAAKKAHLVFEAIVEDVSVKTQLYNTLNANKQQMQYYFSNTSSIPLSLLNENCDLKNKIIGFHFYNPPAIQKLLEIISPKQLDPQLHSISLELAKRLQKKVVPSHDIAGFIGNGHFLREILFACSQARHLMQKHKIPLTHAIYIVNKVTQEYLLRPMGIFQLMDYVGIDICQNIAKIMSKYLNDPSLHDDLIDAMVKANVIGGQHSDGSQKNGFFQYAHPVITGIYSLEDHHYHPLTNETWLEQCKTLLGPRPDESLSWKNLQHDKESSSKMQKYFKDLLASNTEGNKLAATFLKQSHNIGQNLVKTGVANNIEDVNAVLENGFFHLYGVNAYV